jgi:Na+/H+ antiporter NhaC
MKIVNRITIKAFIFLMLAIMGLMITNQALFLHLHKMPDGKVIVHAHPYNKSDDTKPFKSHWHSNAELMFFQHLELLFLFILLVAGIRLFAKKASKRIITFTPYKPVCIILKKGRAPPLA